MAATAVVVALTTTAAGCSAEQPGASGPVEVIASPTVTNLNEATLPLDAYAITADEYSDIDYATKLLARACMKRFGIDWNPGGRLAMGFMRDRSNRLGLADAGRAAAHGYHSTPDFLESQANKEDAGAELTDAQVTILGGVGPGKPANPDVPEGGCYGEARRTLGWNVVNDIWLQAQANEARPLRIDGLASAGLGDLH